MGERPEWLDFILQEYTFIYQHVQKAVRPEPSGACGKQGFSMIFLFAGSLFGKGKEGCKTCPLMDKRKQTNEGNVLGS
jgi:hypothetical protein